MTDNEFIFINIHCSIEWDGLHWCLKHKGQGILRAGEKEKLHSDEAIHILNKHVDIPDYTTDYAAWVTSLYEWIEGQGLMLAFIEALGNLVVEDDKTVVESAEDTLRLLLPALIKATPLQKATALARVIKENR